MIVQPVVEPMDRFAALVLIHCSHDNVSLESDSFMYLWNEAALLGGLDFYLFNVGIVLAILVLLKIVYVLQHQ